MRQLNLYPVNSRFTFRDFYEFFVKISHPRHFFSRHSSPKNSIFLPRPPCPALNSERISVIPLRFETISANAAHTDPFQKGS